jgi:hypothetical protein
MLGASLVIWPGLALVLMAVAAGTLIGLLDQLMARRERAEPRTVEIRRHEVWLSRRAA